MSKWKKIAVVNGGGLVGIIVSLFVVSPHTPMWLFALVSAGALSALNYACFGRLHTAGGKLNGGIKNTIVISLGITVLLLELLFRYWHR